MFSGQELIDRSAPLPAYELSGGLESKILEKDKSSKFLPDIFNFLRHLSHIIFRPTEILTFSPSVVKKYFKNFIP
jgi:hypothetical protein